MEHKVLKLLISALFFLPGLAFAATADYSTPICAKLYQAISNLNPEVESPELLEGIQAELNRQTALKHPGLRYVLDDPDAFIADVERKFEQQKLLTPNDPYLFDYSNVGMPMLAQMQKDIAEKIEELNAILTQMPLGAASDATRKKYPLSEISTNLQFLNDLAVEVAARIKAAKITYKDTIELASFFSNAVGYFDTREFTVFQRNFLKVDRSIEGHYPHSIAEDYRRYKAREFHLFEPGAYVSAGGYAQAGPIFEAAFANRNQLSAIIIPTAEPLDSDVLMRLLSREKISLAGVTKSPIQADGFLRPSSDFFIHDLRHESIKFMIKQKYMLEHNITRAQEILLNQKLDKWLVEMQTMIAKIEDPDVREAALLIVFNFHHDQGFVTAPSVFLGNKGFIHYVLHAALTISGEGYAVRKPATSYPAAIKLLQKFWEARSDDETAFLKSLGK